MFVETDPEIFIKAPEISRAGSRNLASLTYSSHILKPNWPWLDTMRWKRIQCKQNPSPGVLSSRKRQPMLHSAQVSSWIPLGHPIFLFRAEDVTQHLPLRLPNTLVMPTADLFMARQISKPPTVQSRKKNVHWGMSEDISNHKFPWCKLTSARRKQSLSGEHLQR